MAHIITISNQKGGVSKTTTAHAMAAVLSLRGYKTLLVDIDPQANLSYTQGADDLAQGVYELLRKDADISDVIQKTPQGDIVSGSLLLAGADMEFTQTGREYLLKESLRPVDKLYDFIVLDTPPTLGILTINALTASNDVIIPMCADIFSIQGLAQLYNTISKVKMYCNPNLCISGILMTRYNGRTVLSQDLRTSIEEKANQIGSSVYKTVIRESVAIKEAQTQQVSVFLSSPKSNPATDYIQFIDEYLKGVNYHG